MKEKEQPIEPGHPRIIMHDYRCPECGFLWRQQVYVENEFCVACQHRPVEYRGAVERELKPFTFIHKKIHKKNA